MSFALLVCVALILTVGYFVVLLGAEAISWLLSKVNMVVNERRERLPETRRTQQQRIHST